VFIFDSDTQAVRYVSKTHSEDLVIYHINSDNEHLASYVEVPNDGLQLCFVPDSESS